MAFLWWLLKQYYPHFQHQTTQFKELIISGLIQRNKTDDIIIWAINTYPFFFSSKCPATISIKYVKINSFVNFPGRGDSFPFSLYFDFFPSSPSPAPPSLSFPRTRHNIVLLIISNAVILQALLKQLQQVSSRDSGTNTRNAANIECKSSCNGRIFIRTLPAGARIKQDFFPCNVY